MTTAKILTTPALAALLLLSDLSTASAQQRTYSIDAAHSSVTFRVKHLLSNVVGRFGLFSGTVTIDPEARDSVSVEGVVESGSIDTDEKDRDEHLRSADFFDVARFPRITFKAGKLHDLNAERTKAKLSGTLELHGVSKPVTLDAEWLGTATDPWGNRKAAFSARTTINRKDYGIVWNKALDAGGFLVGDLVEIELNFEAEEKTPASPG
ncbi:MAG: YceI family protein [Candidatus Binatia bacterium]